MFFSDRKYTFVCIYFFNNPKNSIAVLQYILESILNYVFKISLGPSIFAPAVIKPSLVKPRGALYYYIVRLFQIQIRAQRKLAFQIEISLKNAYFKTSMHWVFNFITK